MKQENDFNLNVGLRIREIREALDMTCEEFSKKCGISTKLLADMENGIAEYSHENISKICAATNVSVNYFNHDYNNSVEPNAPSCEI